MAILLDLMYETVPTLFKCEASMKEWHEIKQIFLLSVLQRQINEIGLEAVF